MGLLGDILKKKLPTGRKFQAKVGSGSLEKKLYEATRSGALDNLADNQELIKQIASKRQSDIRGGHYTSEERKTDIERAFKDKSLSQDDKKELKGIVEYWGKGDQSTGNTAPVKPTEPSAALKRAAEARARLNPEPVRELPDFLKHRGSVSVSKNPWSGAGNNSGGLGGGISAGMNQGKGFRKPTLLK
ncbi:MAG: hypothetical protein A2406_00600 [Candidatus Komeilibacteria bacterium RIFOXYC1_FULL_37_11]|uniref:Uncharacterized protein n=1 Tax=Candidatus Komeilibacteria bacterium RIFOXYC1_FULL_37_11 TaxID=1798555 RepID=A0A1G2C0A3_9BACT|nr:MAG: hypothetical protein A2406_00600 [Candidatus Komeilibacteria bacterium RIFOXYC1_FULL_37_11]OGY95986.1 MAG: hypothetical protein A2611_04210 [Candidatus Komeilibacteria bacterium RIFOXYD1_FULL_37_29]